MARTRDRLSQRLRDASAVRQFAPGWTEELLIDYVLKSADLDNIANDVDALREQVVQLTARVTALEP